MAKPGPQRVTVPFVASTSAARRPIAAGWPEDIAGSARLRHPLRRACLDVSPVYLLPWPGHPSEDRPA